ncbi:MAG: mercury(II) reductase [Oligoflexus sp.]
MDCYSDEKKTSYDYDLAIIGSGSAAFAAAIKASELGKSVAMIEKGLLGGTCVNVGCVPSKNLIRAAEAKYRAEHSHFAGIKTGSAEVNFKALIQGKDHLVASLRQAKYQSVLDKNQNIVRLEGHASFVDPHTIDISGRKITAEKSLIATGSSPFVPNIDGLEGAGYLTSTTAFELTELPKKIAVLGGGYISLEIAQMFHRLGSKVTIIQRSRILFQEDDDIATEVQKNLENEGVQILNRTTVESVKRGVGGVEIRINSSGNASTLIVDQIIVATGRKPNTTGLGLENAHVELTKSGHTAVNEFCQTTQKNIYAAGDVTESPALVYVAAYEGNLAVDNAFSGNKRIVDYSTVPWVIFSDPQVAGVGLNEAQAKGAGIEYDVSVLSFDNVPRSIAAQDTRGVIKLLRKTGTDQLIGARIVAPEGSELVMELSLVIKYKLPLSEVAGMMHPYLTLAEAVKLAMQTFDKDVKSLSCCAS